MRHRRLAPVIKIESGGSHWSNLVGPSKLRRLEPGEGDALIRDTFQLRDRPASTGETPTSSTIQAGSANAIAQGTTIRTRTRAGRVGGARRKKVARRPPTTTERARQLVGQQQKPVADRDRRVAASARQAPDPK